MTPRQLYATAPTRVSYEIGRLKGYRYNHVSPELNDWDVLPYEDPFKRVELRFYEDHHMGDDRRIWALASVWLVNTRDCVDRPFMVVQNAGREGDDWARRIVTDADAYREAARYLKSLCLTQEEPDELSKDLADADHEVNDLTAFYGRSWTP
jgi:hypothetical protein